MFSLPNNLFNLPWFQNLQNGGLGNKPKWSEINPFRTVEGAGQFGGGLNASAGQLYDHFRSGGRKAMDYGFKPAGAVQGLQDFLERRNPKPVEIPEILPPKLPGNIPGLPPGFQMPDLSKLSIFNTPQFGQRGITPPNTQQPAVSTGMPMVNRPQPGGPGQPQVNPQMPTGPYPTGGGTPGFTGPAPDMTQGLYGLFPGTRPAPQPMTNPQVPQAPQVPQFDASIFNMQPQMMVNRPRPMGV